MSLQDNFRQAMRSYIYSVSVMSNVDSNGDFSAITVSSVTSVSLDPPSLLVCINKSAGIHNTIEEGSSFCINLLNKNQEYISKLM
jgi:flavin reductase (DIM6/NTAB) family NADH-FMN oxidoreductase RutF